jgi:deoxyguanosine kinase
MRYKYIAIEGNIGAGKTTLARAIAKARNTVLIEEEFENNPFLPAFYEDPNKAAFPLEVSLLLDRFRQIQAIKAKNLVSDYWFRKSLVFGNINLKSRDWVLFRDLFEKLDSEVRQPDLVLYFHRPYKKVVKSIKSRGRPYEQGIPADYLSKLEGEYSALLRAERRIPVLWVDGENFDPGRKKEALMTLFKWLELPLKTGINFPTS